MHNGLNSLCLPILSSRVCVCLSTPGNSLDRFNRCSRICRNVPSPRLTCYYSCLHQRCILGLNSPPIKPLDTYQASPEKSTFSFFLYFNRAHYFLEELKLELISQLIFFGGGTCLMLPCRLDRLQGNRRDELI